MNLEESFFAKVIHAAIFIAICAGIVFLGWNEPLRYRFLSPQEIHAIENPPAPPAPAPTPSWTDRRFQGSALDAPPQRAGGMRTSER